MSAALSTVLLVSSRIHSPWGSVGARLARMRPDQPSTARGRVPTHVWVRRGEMWQPGLLVDWERLPDGWSGTVAALDAEGDAALLRFHARDLRPACSESPT